MRTLTRRSLLARGTSLAATSLLLGSTSRAAGMPAAQLDSIGAATSEAVATGDVPGALSIVWQNGEMRCLHRAGVRDLASRSPMEVPTLMGIASMSKPVTVAVALMLMEQGVFRLDDPITRWAPEFASVRVLRKADGPLDETDPAPRAITFQDLMTHRSGLSYGFLTRGPLAGALFPKFGMGIESSMSPDEWMQALGQLPLVHAPGERFTYGFSIDVLGFVIARAARQSLRDLMLERLFAPLKMNDTDFWIPPAKRARAARIYTSSQPNDFKPIDLAGFVGDAPPVFTSGGQGLVSTAEDYLKFARLLIGGGKVGGKRLLRASTVKTMTANHLTPAQRQLPAFMNPSYFAGQGFGFGMSVVLDPQKVPGGAGAGSFGWGGAFGGWWQGDPTRNSILLWMQQCLPAPPGPDSPPSMRVPGARGTAEFQRRAYAALDA
jgi:CubicO group peptidase (beta-lactamase class C family)